MGGEEVLQGYDLFMILSGIIMGTIARVITVRIDSRQVPSYPSGYFINLVTGFIASALGAVAIPALLTRDFTAVTFLALAVQHFRDVRKQEQESLENLEQMEFCERGKGYIDGIAKTYELRNYISMLTALGTVLALELTGMSHGLLGVLVAIGAGVLCIWAQLRLCRSKRIGDICDLHEGNVDIQGADLYVDGIHVTSLLGTEQAQSLFRSEGIAVVVKPREERHRLVLEQLGQRKAMMFDAARSYGVKVYQFTQRDFKDGRVVIAFVPIVWDGQGIIDAIRATPILESGRKRRIPFTKG